MILRYNIIVYLKHNLYLCIVQPSTYFLGPIPTRYSPLGDNGLVCPLEYIFASYNGLRKSTGNFLRNNQKYHWDIRLYYGMESSSGWGVFCLKQIEKCILLNLNESD